MISLLFIFLDTGLQNQFASIALTSLAGGTLGATGAYALINWRLTSIEKKIDKIDHLNDRVIKMESKIFDD